MKKVLKKLIPFSCAFLISIIAVSYYLLDSKDNTLKEQKVIKTQTTSTLYNPPKVTKCKNYLNELRKKQVELKKWIAENQNVSKKQIKEKSKEIREIEVQIQSLEFLKDFYKKNPDVESNYKNLLYKENCYEF